MDSICNDAETTSDKYPVTSDLPLWPEMPSIACALTSSVSRLNSKRSRDDSASIRPSRLFARGFPFYEDSQARHTSSSTFLSGDSRTPACLRQTTRKQLLHLQRHVSTTLERSILANRSAARALPPTASLILSLPSKSLVSSRGMRQPYFFQSTAGSELYRTRDTIFEWYTAHPKVQAPMAIAPHWKACEASR